MRIKRTQNLMLIANPLKNLQKNTQEKRYQQKSDFYDCVQKFSAYNFFGRICCIFFNGLKTLNFSIYSIISISNKCQFYKFYSSTDGITPQCFFLFCTCVLCVRSLCQANAACQFYKFYLIMDGITTQCFSCSIHVSYVSGACVRPMLPVISTSSI
jgi:hypothetical protein